MSYQSDVADQGAAASVVVFTHAMIATALATVNGLFLNARSIDCVTAACSAAVAVVKCTSTNGSARLQIVADLAPALTGLAELLLARLIAGNQVTCFADSTWVC